MPVINVAVLCSLTCIILSEQATRYWATLARDWYGYELGKDSEEVERIQPIVEDPRQHPVWASRDHTEVGDLNYGS